MSEVTSKVPGSGRFDYVRYDEKSQKDQEGFKAQVIAIEQLIETFPNSRPKALALTALEEMYMWIGKMLRDEQVKRNNGAELQESRGNE